MGNKTKLIKSLKNQDSTIAILGLGYVGLPLAIRFAEVGYKVIGIDVDESKVRSLTNGQSYISHIPQNAIKELNSKRFIATSDFSRVIAADALILCVPTPLSKYREPDLSFVVKTTDSIVPYLRKGQVLSLESTTYPGTTEEELLPRMESSGLVVGRDIFLVYSPEREDPGNLNYKTNSIPKICGGYSADCTEVGVALYSSAIDKVVPVSSTKVAEMTKLLENIHRAVNIGLVNEMKIVADKMNINIHEVIDAAATKPFGFTAYYPGPGLGGHCIPIDPFYLTWKAREFGVHTRFIELAGEVNASMPMWVINKTVDALNDSGKALRGSQVLVLGIAYKKNVDDMRESPSVELMEILEEKGANVSYHDPHVSVFPKMRAHNFELSSIDLTESIIGNFDVVILATDHDDVDYELIKACSKILIDTRGKFRGAHTNIIKA